jgi:hypothetical protein
MDQVLDTGADSLDLTDCSDAQELDHSVDSALHAIDETVYVTLSGDPELTPYQASEQLLRLGEELAGVKAKLRAMTADRLTLRMKLARAWRIIHAERVENERLAALLSTSEAMPEPAPQDATSPLPAIVFDEFQRPPSFPGGLLAELAALAHDPPARRRFSEQLEHFAYAFHAISPQAYRFARGALPMLPSITTLRRSVDSEKCRSSRL